MITKDKLLRILFGKHLMERAKATDADPEEIAQIAEAMNEDPPEPVADRKVKDVADLPVDTQENEFQSEDRKRMHDALDAMLDETEPMEDRRKARDRGRRRAKDTDVAELKALLDQFLGEEAEEPEHAAEDLDTTEDPDVSGLEDALAPEAEACPECNGEGCEACDVEAGPDDEEVESDVADADDPTLAEPADEDHEAANDRGRAKDARRSVPKSRAVDGAKETLRMLRPFVARANDAGLNRAFNTALATVTKRSRASAADGGYGGFASASRARSAAPNNPRGRAADSAVDPNAKLQQAYDAARGGK